MREKSIQLLFNKSVQSLKSAIVLLNEGLLDDAVSRSYYTIFYAAKAALLVHGVVVKSHRALRNLFGEHLVQTGELEREWSQILSDEYDLRIMADYDENSAIDEVETNLLVNNAKRFVARVHDYLLTKNIDGLSDLDVPHDDNRFNL